MASRACLTRGRRLSADVVVGTTGLLSAFGTIEMAGREWHADTAGRTQIDLVPEACASLAKRLRGAVLHVSLSEDAGPEASIEGFLDHEVNRMAPEQIGQLVLYRD